MRKIEFSRLVERVINEELIGTLKLWNGETLEVPAALRAEIVSPKQGKGETIYRFITHDGSREIHAKVVEKFTINREQSRTPFTDFEELVIKLINGETEGNLYFKDSVTAHTSSIVSGLVGDKYYVVSNNRVYYNNDFDKFEENEKPLR